MTSESQCQSSAQDIDCAMAAGRNPGGIPACGFLVSATKAGQVPIAVEKRAKGKKVTIISNVSGNARDSASCCAFMRGFLALSFGTMLNDDGTVPLACTGMSFWSVSSI